MTKEPTLELSFPISPDENGVFNGMELAEKLLFNAARLLNPYVNRCPACLDNLFSALANSTLEKLHDAMGQGAEGVDLYYRLKPEPEAYLAHLEAQKTHVAALLEKAGVDHIH